MKFFYFLLLTIIPVFGMSQEISFSYDLYNTYENYREPTLNCRRTKHSDIMPLIEKLRHNGKFVVHKLGVSVEKKELFLIKIGTGKTKIFLWSQMHGDESTATMALFDIFNFFSANDYLNEVRNKILSQATLYFLPMVNPDGAEIFQRRICQPDYRYVQNVRDPILKLFKETKGDTTDPRWQPILEAGGEVLANKKLRYDDGKTTHLPSPFPYTLIHHFIK